MTDGFGSLAKQARESRERTLGLGLIWAFSDTPSLNEDLTDLDYRTWQMARAFD